METAIQRSTGNTLSAPVLTDNAGGGCSASHDARADTGTVLAPALTSAPRVQPIANVAEYLARRRPCADPRAEDALWITVPDGERAQVEELLAAFGRVRDRLKFMSVTRACAEVLRQERFADQGWNAKTFRAQFDTFTRKRDWVCLVNRSKCRAIWRKTTVGLPVAFLKFCASRFGLFRREDGKRQALQSIRRQWRTGRNLQGIEEVIPGYETNWNQRDREGVPAGWHYSNLLRQIKKHGLFTRSQREFLHEGESAARSSLPQILSTRVGLRFLELVTFDDVRVDWLILDPTTGQVNECWLLLARDHASAMVLGFVMHPATVREDGRAMHLGARHMKQLAGWMLERYPLPPYVVNWKLERGTAGLDEAVRAALGEILGHRIAFSITSMIGANASPAGYAEKRKGNSRGKASLESQNRLLHTQGAYIPGQTGNRWDIRPADLEARSAEAGEIWQLAQHLPAAVRGAERYPVLTPNLARIHLTRIFNEQNARTEHALEGFQEVVERIGERFNRRKEMPIERAARLVSEVTGEWTRVSPAILKTFFEHSERWVTVKDNGEISLTVEGRSFTYQHGGAPLPPKQKALAYFSVDDPAFLHLTDGAGAILGTWARRDRVAFGDREGLADAMRYTHLAREAARSAANELAAPEREELEAMRAHNRELMKLGEFTEISSAPEAGPATIGSPVGAALTAVSAAVKSDSKQAVADEKQIARETAAARKTLLEAFE